MTTHNADNPGRGVRPLRAPNVQRLALGATLLACCALLLAQSAPQAAESTAQRAQAAPTPAQAAAKAGDAGTSSAQEAKQPTQPTAEDTEKADAPPADSKASSDSPGQEIKDKWGIEILGVRRAAGGYMLDFRFKVLDVQKAAPLFDRKIAPYLVDQASGAKFAVPNPPKVGPLRTSDKPKADRNYFMFFANPGGRVASGNKVTVVIGKFEAKDLVVDRSREGAKR